MSPLLFDLTLISLTLLLSKERIGYRFGEEWRVITTFRLKMDDVKLYERMETELESSIDVGEVF